jgi:transposase InsO family protein
MGIEHWHSRKGKWWDNAYVERSHLTDDQLLYVPYGGKMKNNDDLVDMARKYMYYYNKYSVLLNKSINTIIFL